MKYIAFIILLALTVAGCSSPPSASALAGKIPTCSNMTDSPEVLTAQEVSCDLSDGASVNVATFANQNDENEWIQNGGSGTMSQLQMPGCCVEGNGWAAVVAGGRYEQIDLDGIQRALGGKQVSGGP